MITTLAIPVVNREHPEAGPTTVVVTAEATACPGLYITPRLVSDGRGGHALDGTFTLVHGPSGLRLARHLGGGGLYGDEFHPDEVDTARQVAAALATTPVDWTQDAEAVKAAIAAHTDEVRAAVRAGKFPPAPADAPDQPALAPNDWPKTEAQATADTVARHTIRAINPRLRRGYDLVGAATADNPEAMRRWLDRLARDIWCALDAGDTLAEQVGEWATEYGLPTGDDADNQDAAAVPEPVAGRFGFRLMTEPGHMSYFEGSVDDLRNAIAAQAQRAEQRFAALMATGDGPMSDGQFRESLIASSAAHCGWTLVAVLRMLRELSPALALRVARMFDDIGINGGNDFLDDVDPDAAPTPVPSPA